MGIGNRITTHFPNTTKWCQRLFKRKPQSSSELPPPPTASPPRDWRLTVFSDDEELINTSNTTHDVIITNPNPETPVFQLPNDNDDDPENPEIFRENENPEILEENGNPVETENPQPIRGHELVKSIFTLGAGTIALIIYQNGKSQEIISHIVLTGLSAGCIAIWKGIVWRDILPQISIYVEQAGIATVLISFKILVASSLPKEFAWIPILMGVLCIPTFLVAVLPRQTTHNIINRVSTLALLREKVTENGAVEEEGEY